MTTPTKPPSDRDYAEQRHAALLAQAAALQLHRAAILQEAAALARAHGLDQKTRRHTISRDIWRGDEEPN